MVGPDLDRTRVWTPGARAPEPKDDDLIDTKVFRRNGPVGLDDPLSHTAAFGRRADAKHDHVPHLFGPDGMPLEADAVVEESPDGVEAQISGHKKIEMHDQGWYHAESNRYEQDELARVHLSAIVGAVIDRQMAGLCRDGRWVNNPNEFPELGLVGTITSNPVIPFPPNDQQYYIRGKYDPSTSRLRPAAVTNFMNTGSDSSTWVRLVDFGQHADAVHLFDEFSGKTHCGRVLQGALDNGYFVEAL